MSPTSSERTLGPHRTAHRRSSSNIELGLRPPRYSAIEGAPSSATDTARYSPEPATIVVSASQSDRRPPRYSVVFDPARGERDRRQRVRRSGSYRLGSSSTAPQLHEYNLRNGSGAKAPVFSTLRLYSRSSASPSSSSASSMRLPTFFGTDLVQGSLDLNLETPQTINSISVSLRGRIVTSAYDAGSLTFLEHPIVSWTRAHGDPRSMLLAPITNLGEPVGTSSRPKKFEGKLSGSYSWPFSFPFLQEIILKDGEASPAPHSFSEKSIRGSVQYDLVVRMSHGVLRSDSKLYAPIMYTPDIKPVPSSTLCQIAYDANLGIPGPHVDPIGWHTLPPTTVRGIISRERNIKLHCTLSLAEPLSYKRGAIIPCHIAFESSDTQGLDVLATPKTLRARLVRRVQYHDAAAVAHAQARVLSGGTYDFAEVNTEIASAVWWVNEENSAAQTPKHREFEGEIHLDKDLQPSCEFALLKVSYAVEVLTFATPVFELQIKASSSGRSTPPNIALGRKPVKVLVSHPVTIATTHSEGPAPIAYTQRIPRSAKNVQPRAHSHSDSLSAIAGVGFI